MEQRELTDPNNTIWTCVQAYAGLSGKAAEKAAAITETKDGLVTVVCTPGGGEQTVRLELEANWLENLSDEELLAAIDAAKKSTQ